jgi:hypothetical protein
MATPIGLRRVSCSAHTGSHGKQCRATKHLTPVLVKPDTAGSIAMPPYVVILLCPKHFKLKDSR